jgi:cytochrome P450
MPLITAVVNETLRLYPAATEIARTALRDAPLGGYLVKAGTIVLPSQYSTHRNPEFWPRADEWLPERWLPDRAAELAPHADKAFFPFSVGPRACIGRYFAVLEMQARAWGRARVLASTPTWAPCQAWHVALGCG